MSLLATTAIAAVFIGVGYVLTIAEESPPGWVGVLVGVLGLAIGFLAGAWLIRTLYEPRLRNAELAAELSERTRLARFEWDSVYARWQEAAPPVTQVQRQRNAALRRRFAAEHQEAPVSPAIERWVERGDAFVIEWGDQLLCPDFQFVGAEPRPVIRQVIEQFREHGASDWELALWFATPNQWLRGAPVDALDDAPERVAFAAQRTFDFPT
ncbi:MAG TPA: hypothetical protein VF529_14310 [Solirubrobacteraceae bacterium]